MRDASTPQRARQASRSVLAASRQAGRAGAKAAGGAGRLVHRVSSASGAGKTGLASLLELTAAGGAGDAFVTIALAGSLFFSASVSEARGRAAFALLITVAPYAVLAPLIGPLLDRVRQGNKFVLMGTLLARGLLCWGMSGAVEHNDTLTLLPAAFGVLVLQKAYVVTKAAVTPRLLPPELSLVTANSRSNMASLIATSCGAGLALGVDKVLGGGGDGAAWVLRVGTFIYLAAMAIALRLPDTVDAQGPADETAGPVRGPDENQNQTIPLRGPAARGQAATAYAAGPDQQEPARGGPPPTRPLPAGGGRRLRFIPQLGPPVTEAMAANATIRIFYGFLLSFLAFILRSEHFGHASDTIALGGLAVAVAVGGMLGTGIGAALRSRGPHAMIFTVLVLATAAAIAGAALFALWSLLAVALVAAVSQTLVKVGLDSILQREIPEQNRSSAFAFSETLHQLALVAGGLIGLALSLTNSGFTGLIFAATGLALALCAIVTGRRRRILRRPARPAARQA